jgi:hypothetical protein
MSFDGPVLAWLILSLFPIALPVLLAVIIRRLLHMQGGCLTLVGLLVIGLLSALGIAAYVDASGVEVKGEVLIKREFLVYHVDGSWNRKMIADISFRTSDATPLVTRSLDLTPSRYDEINQGDFVLLRCPGKPGMLRVVRLEDENTLPQLWYWLTNQPFLFCFAVGLGLILAVRFKWPVGLPMLFFMSGFVTVGAWWIASVGIPIWLQAAALFGSANSVTATVREVHPPYLGEGLQGWISTKLYSPADLILVDLTPVGRSETVLSVDEVDLGTSILRAGQGVTVDYSAANPRVSLVPDATRSFVWKNGLLSSFFALVALAGIGKLAYEIRERSEKRPGVPPAKTVPPKEEPA